MLVSLLPENVFACRHMVLYAENNYSSAITKWLACWTNNLEPQVHLTGVARVVVISFLSRLPMLGAVNQLFVVNSGKLQVL